MEAGEIEPELQSELNPNVNVPLAKLQPDECICLKFYCIVFNFIFSLVIIGFIIYAVNVNILSSYSKTNEIYDTSNSYFHCGWNNFHTHYSVQSSYYGPTSYTENNTWLQQYNDCMLDYSSDIYCDWYYYPQTSGLLWFWCNIISLISLLISLLGFIVILYQKKCSCSKIKWLTSLKTMYIITTLFQSFLPTLLLLIAIISWFQTNSHHHGCWNKQYDYDTELFFSNRNIGQTMLFDIISVILLSIHCVVALQLFFDKKKNKQKDPMLREKLNIYDEFNAEVEGECEGYVDQDIELANMNHVQILPIVPMEVNEAGVAIDKLVEEEDEYLLIKTWFFKSVCVSKYKENYYHKFIENGFDNWIAIKSINNQDLIDIGVGKLGHRKTIMIAIQKL